MAMNKKGISPLIATVLVVGFTIVLAGMVIMWGGDLFKNIQEQQGSQSAIQMACSTGLNNLEVSADKTLGTLTIDNRNNIDITGFRLRVDGKSYGSETETMEGATLDAESKVWKVAIGSLDSVELTGLTFGADAKELALFAEVNVKDVGATMCTNSIKATI